MKISSFADKNQGGSLFLLYIDSGSTKGIGLLNYALDLLIAAVVIICVIIGSRKGAVMMLISALGCIAAFAAAIFVSGAADEYVYDNFVSSAVVSVLETKAEEFEKEYFSAEKIEEIFEGYGIQLDAGQISEFLENSEGYSEVLTKEKFRDTLNNMFIGYCHALTETFSGVLPDEIITEADRYLDKIDMTDMIDPEKPGLIAFDKKSAAELIEREIVRPVMLKTVRMVLFFVTFAVVSVIVLIISAVVRAVRGIPAVRSADGFLGSLLGFLQGIIISAAISAAAGIFVKLTSDGNQYINSGVIAETIVFKWLYSGTLLLLSLILK